jgi:hypothetical protein
MIMEIRMVKCPNCNTVYNAAVNTTCPGCAGGAQSSGFSKTAPVPSPSAPTGVNSFGGQSSGGCPIEDTLPLITACQRTKILFTVGGNGLFL